LIVHRTCDIQMPMRILIALLRLARPAQWVKNIFVFTALIFSGLALEPASVAAALIAFAAFSMASSAIYFLNDYKDMEEDRLHPVKCNRPLASGRLPRAVGPIGALVLATTATLLAGWQLGPVSAGILLTYLAMNAAYSLGLKNLVIIDVLIIAAGFVLRILVGAAAIARLPSTWLILCAVTVSLFLGFTKRRAELNALGDDASRHRRVLAHYSAAFLDQAIAIVTAATVVCYILYTVDDHTVGMVGSRLMLLSVPLVLYGIFRYLYLVYHDRSGGDPTRTVFTDVPMLLTGALWSTLCTIIIIFGKDIRPFFM